MHGKIIKGIGGLYYVNSAGDRPCADDAAQAYADVYECKARGVFRKDRRRPLVGDDVEMEVLDGEKRRGSIVELLPRRSELVRPAVANVDQALVVFSVVKPQPNFNLLDRLLVMMGRQGVPCVICFNKLDMDGRGDGERYRRIYQDCGYEALTVSAAAGDDFRALHEALEGRTTVVAGPSGVGKSSLVNRLQSGVVMETGEISAKVERGKHTTRHSELIPISRDTYIMDTPGFSALDLPRMGAGELAVYYPEFARHTGRCRFDDCAHIHERDCGVKDAAARGEIDGLRYGNYRLLYEELEKAGRREKK